MPLETGKALRGENIEKVGGEDVKWIRHVQTPKQEYPVAGS